MVDRRRMTQAGSDPAIPVADQYGEDGRSSMGAAGRSVERRRGTGKYSPEAQAAAAETAGRSERQAFVGSRPEGSQIYGKDGDSWANPNAVHNRNYMGYDAQGDRKIERIGDANRLSDKAYEQAGFRNNLAGYAQNYQQGQQGYQKSRADHTGARGMLLNALSTEGPSAAEMQLRQGGEQAARQALSLARSGRGYGGAGAERMAAFQGAQAMQQANQQAGIMRAQEDVQRRNQMQGLVNSDINMIAGDRGAQLQALQGAGQLAAGQQSAWAQQAQNQAQLDFETARANAGYANYEEAQGPNEGLQLAGAGLGAVASMIPLLAMSDEHSKQNIKNLQAENRGLLSAMGLERNEGDGDSLYRRSIKPGVRNRLAIEGAQAQAQDTGQSAGLAAALASADAGPSPAPQAAPGGQSVAGGIARFGDAMASMGQGTPGGSGTLNEQTQARDTFRLAPSKSYEYKPGAMGTLPGVTPGQHIGPMAQDLERTPAGAQAVIDTPAGKVVNTGRLGLVNAAATSELTGQADEHEARLRALEEAGMRSLDGLDGHAMNYQIGL